jgi:hypothetical protein
MHLIGWTVPMWPSLFRITDWIADIDRSKNRVWTGATGLYTVFGPVYISINRNFKTPSMILIKSILKMFICLYVRFYLFLKLQFLLRFLDSFKNVYFVCLQFNKHNSYWYREQYQDIQTALGSWYRPWNRYFPRLWLGKYHFHCSVPRTLGSLYILILPSISVTIIAWQVQVQTISN